MMDVTFHARTAKRCFLRWVSKYAEPHLRALGMLQTVKIKRALVGDPGGGRVLVLAPHMDDEVIGCGGAICKHVRKGAEVTVVFVTDGKHGNKDLSKLVDEDRRKQEVEVARTRRRESEKAIPILGVQRVIYWDAEEFTLTASKDLPAKLADLLATVQPDLVYLPFFLEEHPDHRAISWVLAEAVDHRAFRFDCLGYEVWTPLFPNYFVDISDVIQIKAKALQEYPSQLADTNYIHTVFGLNAFRSAVLLHSKGYAEAFFYASLKEYLDLYRDFRSWQQS
jgi:N-acetylglucosamine malate deacetylase 1